MRLLLLLSLAALPAVAQTTVYGSLRGTVLDPQGLAVGKASGKLQNRDTGLTVGPLRGIGGEYQFARVTPGSYRLTVEGIGFKKAVRATLLIPVNETVVADVK